MNYTNAIERSGQEILALVQDFDQASFNYKPDSDSWSLGQVIEHLSLVNIGMLELYKHALNEPAKHVNFLKRFLPFELLLKIRLFRVKAPEQVVPKQSITFDKLESLTRFANSRSEIIKFFRENSERLSKITPHHPIMGYFTGLGLQRVVLGHDRRHMQQMRRILSQI